MLRWKPYYFRRIRIWHIRSSWDGYDEKIINNSIGHKDFPNPKDFICTARAKGRLITRPSILKIRDESQRGLVESLIKRIKWIIYGHCCRIKGCQPAVGAMQHCILQDLSNLGQLHIPHMASVWERKYFPSAHIKLCDICASIAISAYTKETPPEAGMYEPMTGDLHEARYADCISQH